MQGTYFSTVLLFLTFSEEYKDWPQQTAFSKFYPITPE